MKQENREPPRDNHENIPTAGREKWKSYSLLCQVYHPVQYKANRNAFSVKRSLEDFFVTATPLAAVLTERRRFKKYKVGSFNFGLPGRCSFNSTMVLQAYALLLRLLICTTRSDI